MEIQTDMHELQEINLAVRDVNEPPDSLISEMGVTRRRTRTLNSRVLRRSRRNVIDMMPSNRPDHLLMTGGGDADNVDGISISTQAVSFASDVEIRAEQIVRHIEQNKALMEDNPKSETDRIVALREMTECLTLKRNVKRKLTKTVSMKSKPISFTKRLKYRLDIFLSKVMTNLKNFTYSFELWYGSLKTIEGHFGSSVASYFKFLRKLFILNIIVFIFTTAFVIVPQLLLRLLQVLDDFNNNNGTETNNEFAMNDITNISHEIYSLPRIMMKSDAYKENGEFRFGNIFTGEGFLNNTVLFYGYYANISLSLVQGYNYHIPTAYFFTSFFCYFIVFLSLSISMAVSYRKSFIETSGGVKNVFANKVFCGWDFSIATRQAAELKSRSIYMELKELLDEQSRKKEGKDCLSSFYVIVMQISLNALFLLVIGTVGFYTWKYVDEHMNNIDTATTMMMSLTLTVVIILGPIFFSWIVQFEDYDSPRSALYMTLIRTFTLDGVVVAIVLAYRLSKSAKTECWETTLGQEIYRLVLLDFIFGLIGTALAELIRYRIFKQMWKGIGCPEFDIARNTMNLIYNQTLFYVGLYFSPVLSLVIILKMFLTFYIKKWGAVYNCKPSSKPWRAAQTHTVFLAFTFLAFFGVIVLYGYILTSIYTSSCGPFRGRKIMYESVLNEILVGGHHSTILTVLLYVTRPGIVAVILMAMLLGVYYLRSVAKAREHVVGILQDILRLEAEDKKFLLKSISKFSERNFMDDNDHYGNNQTNVIQTHYDHQIYEGSKKGNSDDEQDLYERILKEGRKWRSTADEIDKLSKNDKDFKKVGRFGRGGSGLFRSTQNINSHENNLINSRKKLFQSAHNVYDEFVIADLGHRSQQASTSKLMDGFDQHSIHEYPSYTIISASSNNYGYQDDDHIPGNHRKNINFNPVYTPSHPYYSDEDEGESDGDGKFSQRSRGYDQTRYDYPNYEGEPNLKYVPHSYDDRVPSRISFDSNRTNTSSKKF